MTDKEELKTIIELQTQVMDDLRKMILILEHKISDLEVHVYKLPHGEDHDPNEGKQYIHYDDDDE